MAKGIKIRPDQCALVWDKKAGWQLFISEYVDTADIPDEVVAMGALIIKLREKNYVQELKDEMNIMRAKVDEKSRKDDGRGQ